MSHRLDHLVRQEEAELQELDIRDGPNSYANDIVNREDIGALDSPKSPRASNNASTIEGAENMSECRGSPHRQQRAFSGSQSSDVSMFGSPMLLRQFLKTPVTTPNFVQCIIVREKVRFGVTMNVALTRDIP